MESIIETDEIPTIITNKISTNKEMAIKETADIKETKDIKETADIKETKDIKETVDIKETKDIKETVDIKETKDIKETADIKEIFIETKEENVKIYLDTSKSDKRRVDENHS